MFRGTFYHTIDDKGRLIIPARFRDVIQCSTRNLLMLSRLDGCLVAYTLEEWRKIEQDIAAINKKNAGLRRFRRFFVGGAFECPLDKQNRILIPPALRQYAALEKDIALVGVLDHAEIWSRSKLEENDNQAMKDLENEEVQDLIDGLRGI